MRESKDFRDTFLAPESTPPGPVGSTPLDPTLSRAKQPAQVAPKSAPIEQKAPEPKPVIHGRLYRRVGAFVILAIAIGLAVFVLMRIGGNSKGQPQILPEAKRLMQLARILKAPAPRAAEAKPVSPAPVAPVPAPTAAVPATAAPAPDIAPVTPAQAKQTKASVKKRHKHRRAAAVKQPSNLEEEIGEE